MDPSKSRIKEFLEVEDYGSGYASDLRPERDNAIFVELKSQGGNPCDFQCEV